MANYSDAGRTRFLMVSEGAGAAGRWATERYQAEKARLEERANDCRGPALDPTFVRRPEPKGSRSVKGGAPRFPQ